MTTAAIYCRVSTDNQETEGTSLQTQLEACLKYCCEKGYDVVRRFIETYSGLSLERPLLNELRDLVRSEKIDAVVVYSTDRFSRDPTHGVILTQELEKYGVKLEAVTETVESTELGKLISYIRGFASKLEAEKIRERTMRGRKAKVQQGRLVGGGVSRTYGYDYVRAADKNGNSRRVINENEAKWVRQIFSWLVDDAISTRAITIRLRTADAPTKTGVRWGRSSVIQILKNPVYTGKTFALTSANGKQFSRPRDDWIEIPDITPAIISSEMFEAAQRQLQVNRARSSRNVKREYLLRSHIYCRNCGKAYGGGVSIVRNNDQRYENRRYRCSSAAKSLDPTDHCSNKSWGADKLEALVWAQIERILDKPELIVAEIEKQRHNSNQLGVLQGEMQQVERQLKGLDREQKELLDNALRGFPESLIIAENKKINGKRASLESQKKELEAHINASQEAAINLPNLERFVTFMQEKLKTLDFASRRMALDMLNIKVWIDRENVEITGALPVSDDVIVTTHS